jgi:Integrase zinc binding domain
MLEDLVLEKQQEHEVELLHLWEEVGIQSKGNGWYKDDALVVLDKETCKRILEMYHDHIGAGHPGILKTYNMVKDDFWWPNQWDFVTKYVQGCATCQSTKLGTTWPKVPLMPITPKNKHPHLQQ